MGNKFPGGQLVGYGTEGHGVVAVIAGGFQAAEGGRKVDVARAGGQVDCHSAGVVGQADCADAGDAESIAESINEAVYALRRQVGVVDGESPPEERRGDGVEKVAAFVNGYGPGNGLRRRPARG